MNFWKSSQFIVSIASLFLFLGMSVREAQAVYLWQKSITVNANQVSGGPLVQLPHALQRDRYGSCILGANASGLVQNANGYDIAFRDSSENILNYEVVYYNGSTGQLIAWVKVPTINNGTNIFIEYDDSTITTSQQNKTGVWGSDYGGVWHLAENLSPYKRLHEQREQQYGRHLPHARHR